MEIASETRAPAVGAPQRSSEEGKAVRRSTEHWFVLAAALAGIALLALFALLIEPDPRGFGTHEKFGLPSCKTMDWFGVPCPGCGVTTSVALAARGRVLESIRNQPFGLVVALAIPIAAAWAARGHLKGRDLWRDLNAARIKPWAIGLGTALAVCWVYKLALVFGLIRWPTS